LIYDFPEPRLRLEARQRILRKRETPAALCEFKAFYEKLLFAQSRYAAKIRKELPVSLSIYFESLRLSSSNFVLYKTESLIVFLKFETGGATG
jgi:hypothetical protein